MRRISSSPRIPAYSLQLESLETRETPAAIGSLDPTFGTGGVAGLGENLPAFVDVAIQQDGKLVAVGNQGDDFFIARFNTNGTVDTGFGNNGNGRVTVDIGGDSDPDVALAVAVDAQNRIVVVGSGGSAPSDFALVRLSADGKTVEINEDYGVGEANAVSTARDVAFQPDGTIVIVGDATDPDPLFGDPDIAVIRVNPTTGAQIGDDIFVDGSIDDRAVGVAVYQSGPNAGKIAVVGTTDGDDILVGLLNADGTPSDFDVDGRRVFGLGGTDRAAGIAISPAGSIIVAGTDLTAGDVAVAALLPDGTFDPAFNGGFVRTLVNPGTDTANDVAVQPNGQIVVVGDTNENEETAILRLEADGTFSGDLFSFNIGNAAADDGNAVAIAPNGRIVVAADDGEVGFLLRVIGSLEGLSSRLVIGGSTGTEVLVFDPNPANPEQLIPTTTASAAPFGNLGSNLRVATGDVNGDGVPDLALITGPGTPIRATVLDGKNYANVLVPAFDPFPESAFDAGGFISAADLNGDGRDELVISPDRRGGPRVVVRSVNADGSTTQLASFIGIADDAFRGGARTTVGDFNGDGTPDIAVAAGYEGGPRVSIFDGTRIFAINRVDDPADKLRVIGGGLGDFFAFPADSTRNGVYLAAGDVNGDGFADLILGAAAGNNAPLVRVVSGQGLIQPGGNVAAVETPFAEFIFGDAGNRGGVRVGAIDADGDGRAEVVAASGEATPARVRIYPGGNVGGNAEPAGFQELVPFAGSALLDGVYVG